MTRAFKYGILTAAAVFLLIAVPLLAGPFGGPRPDRTMGMAPGQPHPHTFEGMPGRRGGIDQMADELKLTTEQRGKLVAARDAFRLSAIDLRADIAKKRLEVEQGMRDEAQTSDQQMQKLFEQQAALRARLAMERYRLHHTISTILTTGQRQKLRELRAERFEQRPRPFEHRGFFPHRPPANDDDENDDDAAPGGH